MAITPTQNDALLREIDEAVRQDDMLSIWKNYGRIIIGAVVLGLAAFGGWLYWQHHQTKVAEENSVQFASLLTAAQRATLDQPVYDKLLAEAGPGYRAQAELVKAAIAAGKGDSKTAIATYDAIIADPEALAPAKDAALLRKVALGFDTMKPQDAISALKPLAVAGNPWFGSAGELTGIAHLKLNQRDQAGKVFAAIAADASVPESIKLRAGQMASMLGSLPAPTKTAPAMMAPASAIGPATASQATTGQANTAPNASNAAQ